MKYKQYRRGLDWDLVEEVSNRTGYSGKEVYKVLMRYCRRLRDKAKDERVYGFDMPGLIKFRVSYRKISSRRRLKRPVRFTVTDGYLRYLEKELKVNIFERILRRLDYLQNASTDRKKLRKRYKFESRVIQNIIKNEFKSAEKAAGDRFWEIRERVFRFCKELYLWLKGDAKYGGLSLEDMQGMSSEGDYRRLAVKVCRDGMRMRFGSESVS